MSSVDDRIVNMEFNNKQFVAGAAESQKSLEGLDRTIAGMGKNGGMAQFSGDVDKATSKFGALKVAGIAAIATVASKATSAGLNLVKSFAVDPILDGFHEYETNLNSVQTIMANTGKDVNTVNKYLNNLNHYSDKTIYNFAQMAKNIGTFTAAGVDLKTSTASIKGIANLAALSGSNAEQASMAMYQLSQAIASGKVGLQDWNSVVNAGMGGKVFQQALADTASAMGTIDKGAVKLEGPMKKLTVNGQSFRESISAQPGQESWLTSEVLTATLQQFTGDLKEADLVAQGFTKSQAKAIMQTAKTAQNAATRVKTFTQLIDVVKESVGSGWAKIFQDLFGNFKEASKLWTGVSTSITGVVSNVFGAVDKMLVGWRNLGGYQELWNGFANIFKIIGNLIHPFVAAFQTLVPSAKASGSALEGITHGFELVTHWLEVATRGFDILTPVLTAVFGVFKLLGPVLGAVAAGLKPLGPALQEAVHWLTQMAQQGNSIAQGLIDGLLKGLDVNAIKAAVMGFANNIVNWIKDALGIHSPSTEMIPVGEGIVMGIVQGMVNAHMAIFNALAQLTVLVIKGIGTLVHDAAKGLSGLFTGFTAMDWASLFNAILTGATILALKKGIEATTSLKQVLKSIDEVIQGVGDSLKAWQSSLKAKMILDIAIAVGILTASIIALSFVDPKKIAISLGAITTMMTLLAGSMLALSKIKSDKQMAIIAVSITLISGAMVSLATAVAILGALNLNQVVQGVGAMAAIMGILVGAMLAFSKIKGSIEGMAASMFVIAAAMNIMAGAIIALGLVPMKVLEKGLGSVAAGLALFVGAMLAMDRMKGSPEGLAGSVLIMSAAMVVLSAAVLAFGNMDMKTLAKGFGAIAVGLALFVGALLLLGTGGPETLMAATSMLLMATAMNVLLSVVLTLGTAPWDVVARGLGFVAAALAIFLLAAAGAEVVAVGLEVLGSSLLMIGAAFFLAGTGMAAFGTGFALMAATGTAGIAVMIGAIHAFLALLPEIAIQIAAAFVAFIKVIANSTTEIRQAFDKIFANIIGVITDNIPQIVNLVVKLAKGMLDAIDRVIPKFGHVISTLIHTGLQVLVRAIPDYVDAGTKIILGVLDGLNRNLPKIIDKGTDLVVNFIEGMGKATSRITDAAGRTILSTLHAIDASVQKYAPQIASEGKSIAVHLVEGLASGLVGSEAMGKISGAVSHIMDAIPDKVKHIMGIGSPSKRMMPYGKNIAEGVAKGIAKGHKDVVAAVIKMADAIIAAGDKQVLKAQKAARALQTKAYAAQARADLKAADARDAAKFANQHKKDKAAQKRAKAAKKAADKAQNAADQAQKKADAGAKHVENVRAFQEADLQGKGDIRNQQATAAADRANKMLATAHVEADRARQLMKTNRKAGQALLKQAKKDADEARKLAKSARESHQQANAFYKKSINQRIKQMNDQQKADAKARKDEEAFNAADAAGKSEILTKRADADEKKAQKAKADSKRLMQLAKKWATKDVKKANEFLDRADAKAQEAQDAADQAAQERQQAQDVLTEGATGGGTSPTNLTLSHTALEDAAKAIDRYTASLRQAEEAAGATQGPVQFTQNNYSPTALTSVEIYRQSKNLLSAAEVKMGVVPTP